MIALIHELTVPPYGFARERSEPSYHGSMKGILLASAILAAGGAVFFAADTKLPPPFATPSANNRPRVIPKPADAKLNVPAGFAAEVWAEGFEKPRYMILGPSQEIILSDAASGDKGAVYVMRNAKDRRKIIE